MYPRSNFSPSYCDFVRERFRNLMTVNKDTFNTTSFSENMHIYFYQFLKMN